MEAGEEFGVGSGEEDAVSDGWGEVLVVGVPSEYLLLEVEGDLVAPAFEVEV